MDFGEAEEEVGEGEWTSEEAAELAARGIGGFRWHGAEDMLEGSREEGQWGRGQGQELGEDIVDVAGRFWHGHCLMRWG